MKSCIYCGKEYPDEASVCAFDGQPLLPVISTSPAPAQASVSERQRIIDGEHIKLLSIFHFVVAGLAFCGVGFLLLHYLVMSRVFANPEIWKSQTHGPPLPKDFFKYFVWFYIFMGAILVSAGTLNLLSGYFLRQRRHRTFSMVVGGLNCLQIPFGTVLGVFTLMVLLRNSVRETYAA
jgi:hypothetical protein